MIESDAVRPRQRTITWIDPIPDIEKGMTMSGLEYLRALMRGELASAPIAATMGMTLEEVEDSRVVFAAEPGEHLYNPIGTIHGGLVATLLDSAMACAIHTTLPPGVRYTTLELHVNYVRPVLVSTGRIVCEGRVVHRGSTVSTAEGRVTSTRDGKLLAHGTTTCLVIAERPRS